ncbi:sulfatase [Gramella sp. AN32]|uniref:Sulfatase n=1 Tax=Christiangramia antarctica TaxID=2058158 RepID=A0ABW5X2T4_9FLAO|nr:sulfatase [Gramella sp. AN32]MCM4156714.1 sulfatase [Gramella sp. AN32]
MINNLIFLRFLLVITFCGQVSFAQGDKPYNILWITVEDMSPKLGCYGDKIANTPNIDRLATEGVRYTNAYATYGVCAPSRHTLITGMYPTSTGAMAMRTWKRTSALSDITDPELLNIPVYEATPPAGVKCFSEYFRAAGYYCTNNSKTDYQFKEPITAWDDSSENAHWRNRPSESKPFFSVFNSMTTHEGRIFKKYNPEVTEPNDIKVPPYYPDTKVIRQDIARHYDNIHAMDRWVGDLMAQLKDDGLLDNTIIFFFSDHGDGLPRAKRWVYDSGIQVPLIIRYPDGYKAGTVNNELVSFIDFAPTTMSVAGLIPPDYMEGNVFLGDKKEEPRDYIYAFRDRMDPAPETIRAVRDKRFKYVYNYRPELPYLGFIPYRDKAAIMQEILKLKKDGELKKDQWQFWAERKSLEELYDTQNDPFEIHNLASNPNYFQKLNELRNAHINFIEEYGDLGLIPESELIEILWPPHGKQPVTAAPKISISEKTIILSSETEGASIAYRFNQNDNWQLYSNPIKNDKNSSSIEAVAIRIGWEQSKIVKEEIH